MGSSNPKKGVRMVRFSLGLELLAIFFSQSILSIAPNAAAETGAPIRSNIRCKSYGLVSGLSAHTCVFKSLESAASSAVPPMELRVGFVQNDDQIDSVDDDDSAVFYESNEQSFHGEWKQVGAMHAKHNGGNQHFPGSNPSRAPPAMEQRIPAHGAAHKLTGISSLDSAAAKSPRDAPKTDRRLTRNLILLFFRSAKATTNLSQIGLTCVETRLYPKSMLIGTTLGNVATHAYARKLPWRDADNKRGKFSCTIGSI
jgi:hypothetical protein